MRIGKRLSELRKKHGFTQEQLADRLGTTRQAVSKWESEKSNPDLDYVIQMGKIFGVSMDYLLLGTEPAFQCEQQPKRSPRTKTSEDRISFIIVFWGFDPAALPPVCHAVSQPYQRVCSCIDRSIFVLKPMAFAWSKTDWNSVFRHWRCRSGMAPASGHLSSSVQELERIRIFIFNTGMFSF